MKLLGSLLGVTLLVLSSCGSTKSVSNTPADTSAAADRPVTAQTGSLTQQAEMLARSYKDWSELSLPLKIELNFPARFSASGRAYMRRGKDIYISIRMLGFEVATAYIDSDSVRVADKFNKRYMAESVSKVLAGAKLTVADIQDLLLGRAFVTSMGTFTTAMMSNVEIAESNEGWSMTPKTKVAGASYSFGILGTPPRVGALNVEFEGHKASCAYASPVETKSGTFMQFADITAPLGSKKLSVTIRWDFSGAKYEVSNSVGWKIPKGYTRIQASSLVKNLKF